MKATTFDQSYRTKQPETYRLQPGRCIEFLTHTYCIGARSVEKPALFNCSAVRMG
jgi:hypothetical protein